MNKKKFILLALLLLCAYFYELFGGMPATVPFAPQPVKADTSLLKVEIADDLPLIYADAALLEHVVLNLLDNAVKYSVEGSEIEIQTCLDDSEVIVMVKDRGLGVTAKDLPHLFDKFYRARQTEKISGTGLGLAICKGIVDAHRGRIWAKQRTGGGSIFAFALPVTLPEEKAGEKND